MALHSNHKQVLAVAMPSDLILPSNVILLAQDSWKQERMCSFSQRMSIFFCSMSLKTHRRYAGYHEATPA
jgi:hypothetical protein